MVKYGSNHHHKFIPHLKPISIYLVHSKHTRTSKKNENPARDWTDFWENGLLGLVLFTTKISSHSATAIKMLYYFEGNQLLEGRKEEYNTPNPFSYEHQKIGASQQKQSRKGLIRVSFSYFILYFDGLPGLPQVLKSFSWFFCQLLHFPSSSLQQILHNQFAHPAQGK